MKTRPWKLKLGPNGCGIGFRRDRDGVWQHEIPGYVFDDKESRMELGRFLVRVGKKVLKDEGIKG